MLNFWRQNLHLASYRSTFALEFINQTKNEMKKLTTLVALILTVLSFSSCEKKTVQPTSTTTASSTPNESINVQYRVTSASGNFEVEYVSVDDDEVKTVSVEVKKMSFTHSFTWTTKQNLSIKASNVSPSSKELLVEIYVDGVLFKSGSANAPGAVAVAEGVYTK